MGGKEGNRGYLVQSIIALLESLEYDDWISVTLEPDHGNEKIDISWDLGNSIRASQVKSSIRQIGLAKVQAWSEEMVQKSDAESLSLILIGPCSGDVTKLEKCEKVRIPTPKNLDLEGMLGLAAHRLDKFLSEQKIESTSPHHRELMAKALVTEMSMLACDAKTFVREELVALLKKWIGQSVYPLDSAWEQVDFEYQRGIENAIAGKRLGPSDVETCPEFPVCDDLIRELERSHSYSIVGQPGCGKSITLWQAAKKFHDRGFAIWRPRFDAEASELLDKLPSVDEVVLIIDDAQRFGKSFVKRMEEHSSKTLKVVFANTLGETIASQPIFISPKSCVEHLKEFCIANKTAIMPIVRSYDSHVGDSYMDTSFEDRVEACARQSTPWEFFWILRGDWRTARKEFESVKQILNADFVLSVIAFEQIGSCDAGVRHEKLLKISEKFGVQLDTALPHLIELELVQVQGGILRTKHISYAYRVVEECLASNNFESWTNAVEAFGESIMDDQKSLKGVYWLLDSILRTDATRFSHKEKFRSFLDPILNRTIREWNEDRVEWAPGCLLILFGLLDFKLPEMLIYKSLVLEIFTGGTARTARFGSGIANCFINESDKDGEPSTKGVAKALFDEIDKNKLVDWANSTSLDDFYSMGDLINRIAFYGPSWAGAFLAEFDWGKCKREILSASPEKAYAVDKLVHSLEILTRVGDGETSLKFITEIQPYLVRVISQEPMSITRQFHDLFWNTLGLMPRFLRGRYHRTKKQHQCAKNIVDQLDPSVFAESLRNPVNRDLENLARTLAIIYEVDHQFVSKIGPLVPKDDFLSATESDWQAQSSELKNLLSFFALGSDREPARSWVIDQQTRIQGPLHPLLIYIAPEVAVDFFKSDKGATLIGLSQHRWNATVSALGALADHDQEVCVKILKSQLHQIEHRLYELTLDPPQSILILFRMLHHVSPELFNALVARLDVQCDQAQSTIQKLVKTQHREKRNYTKLARIAKRNGGQVAVVGSQLLEEIAKAEKRKGEK